MMMLAISAGSTVAKLFGQFAEDDATQAALNTQAKLNTLQYGQKILQNYDIQGKIMSTQVAQMAGRGLKLNSPSFQAIEENTYNTAAKGRANINTEKISQDANIAIERQNADLHLEGEIFGDLSDAAKMGYKANEDSVSNA